MKYVCKFPLGLFGVIFRQNVILKMVEQPYLNLRNELGDTWRNYSLWFDFTCSAKLYEKSSMRTYLWLIFLDSWIYSFELAWFLSFRTTFWVSFSIFGVCSTIQTFQNYCILVVWDSLHAFSEQSVTKLLYFRN